MSSERAAELRGSDLLALGRRTNDYLLTATSGRASKRERSKFMYPRLPPSPLQPPQRQDFMVCRITIRKVSLFPLRICGAVSRRKQQPAALSPHILLLFWIGNSESPHSMEGMGGSRSVGVSGSQYADD